MLAQKVSLQVQQVEKMHSPLLSEELSARMCALAFCPFVVGCSDQFNQKSFLSFQLHLLLTMDPLKRPSAAEAMNHDYFKLGEKPNDEYVAPLSPT